MAAPRALWRALVSLYEDTLTLLGGNLAWLALNLPLYLVLVFVSVPFTTFDENVGPQSVFIVIAWLLLFMPSPGGIGLAALAAAAAGPDIPRMSIFWRAVRARWRLSLMCMLVSGAVAVALLANLYFYGVMATEPWMRIASFLWLYAALFWLGMHVYLLPLLVHVNEPRVLDLYRRAALITLGHPIYTLVLLIAMLLIGSLTLIFLPVYVLIGGAYIALVQAHAFREIRRRHGDLPVETDEGMKAL